LEVIVEEALGDIPGIVRQFSVFDPQGRFIARADFAIPELKIAIEAHSRKFHFASEREEHDSTREALLQEEGWLVRYITRAQARNRRALRSSVLALVKARRAA
jgi:very-short-patch-repair endonuclease